MSFDYKNTYSLNHYDLARLIEVPTELEDNFGSLEIKSQTSLTDADKAKIAHVALTHASCKTIDVTPILGSAFNELIKQDISYKATNVFGHVSANFSPTGALCRGLANRVQIKT